mmetsp:Transcript_32956/g.71180  ORF Transcript_32956/g.71180 Transcript_32956/m.71180 type:complete len:108 (+) Transcript_32956:97-420(+)
MSLRIISLSSDAILQGTKEEFTWTNNESAAQDLARGQRNLKSFQLTTNTGNLHLTSPLGIALFGLVEEAPRALVISNLYVVKAGKLARESLLVYEPRTSSACDCGGV